MSSKELQSECETDLTAFHMQPGEEVRPKCIWEMSLKEILSDVPHREAILDS